MGLIKALFLDVGGVLMTNGWDSALRKKTAAAFDIDYEEFDIRHQLVFDTYERGLLTFDEYLFRTVFYETRNFSSQDLKQFIFDSVRPYSEMLQLVKELKARHQLKIGVVSNEGRELAIDRIHRFDLSSFIDFFIVSSFVHFRKPDPAIYRLAMDVVQVPPSSIVYIDDRALLIEVAKEFGIQGIHHKNIESTKVLLAKLFDEKN